MNLSVMTVMLLVAMIGNNTATLTTTAKLSLSTTEAMIIAQTTTEAIHTTPATNTASTSTTNTTTASNAANITTSDEVNASTSSLRTISDIVPETTLSCQNGGIYDNGICKCLSNFEGKFCETIKNIITVDNGTTAYLNVSLRFTNMEFTENLIDITSVEYKEFERYFKRQMSIVYESVTGFEGIKILSIRPGSVIVLHEIIVRFQYKPDVNIADRFKEALKDVDKKLVELSKDCHTNPEMCIAEDFNVSPSKEPISHEEQCRQNAKEGFEDFFSPAFESGIPICVSHCDEKSSHFKNCHKGTCLIEKWAGPRCFCSDGDLYLYTDSQCGGKISKLSLFIGGGVALAVLVIITITLGICLYRAKSQTAQSNELFYETVK